MNGPLHYFGTETSQSVSLGTRYAQESSGKVWRYAENGGSTASPGKMMVQATHTTDWANLAPTAAVAVNSTSIILTLGSTGVSADDILDGELVINTGGVSYGCAGHAAYDAAATDAEFNLKEVLQVALTTSSDVDLVKNLYKDVVISVSDQVDKPVGVFNVTVAANAYAMIQTWGPAAVQQDTTNGIGDFLVTGSSSGGEVEVADAAGEPFIGHQGPYAGAADDYQLVYLRLER